ncbi:hypothetical protein Hanom_Chr06g00558201 [Helianthus anomalus]
MKETPQFHHCAHKFLTTMSFSMHTIQIRRSRSTLCFPPLLAGRNTYTPFFSGEPHPFLSLSLFIIKIRPRIECFSADSERPNPPEPPYSP